MIEKVNFRDQIRDILLKKMRENKLDPKKSISLASLAREMDVSVTPIREALTQLQISGIIESIPNRGFFIPEPNKAEAHNLYELVASLECLAIKNSTFNEDLLDRLKESNQTYIDATDKIQRINADMNFHNLLTSNCKNPITLKLLSDLKIRIFFYETDFMDNQSLFPSSSNEHSLIIKEIERNNIDKACEILMKNWLKILDHLNY